MSNTSYSWSSDFVLPYESEWSIEEKFCYLNALHSIGIGKSKIIIPIPEDYKTHDKIHGYRFKNYHQKICPICIRFGYHSMIHNLEFFEYCFIHKKTRLKIYSGSMARLFEDGEPLKYEFLHKVRTIDLIYNPKLRMKIDAYRTLVKGIFPDCLCILDFKCDKEQGKYGELYNNTKFSLMERCFMPNNPWFKGKYRLLLQINTSEISLMNKKCLWKTAKYCRKRNTRMIPSDIYTLSSNEKLIKYNTCDFRLGIVFKNYFEEKIMKLFTTKEEYDDWIDSIIKWRSPKLNGLKIYSQLSMYLIYRSISDSNLSCNDAISQWKEVEFSKRNNFMPVTFFDINYLEDNLDKSLDRSEFLCFKEIIMKDALDYAIQELSCILKQKLISLDDGVLSSYYPVKFPQYIIKRTDNKWNIIACDPPEGLPDDFFIYKEIYNEYMEKYRNALRSISIFGYKHIDT